MFRSVIPAALVLAALACQNPVSAGATLPLTLTASVSASALAPGQPDTITVTLTNTSAMAVTLHFASGCQILPYIADETGAVVLPSGDGWLCPAVLSTLSLGPRQQQHVQFVWTGGTELDSAVPSAALPRGTYFVYGALKAREGTFDTQHLPVSLQ